MLFIDAISLIILSIASLTTPTLYRGIIKFDLITSILLILIILIPKIINKNRKSFIKRKWIVILACIPFDYIFLSFNLENIIILSIFRILHIIALLISIYVIGSKFIKFINKTGLDYGLFVLSIIFIVSTLIFYIIENPLNTLVNSYYDAIWYGVVSITSTGYGDIIPVTASGKLIGIILMVSGVVFTAFATASSAAALYEKYKRDSDKIRKENEEKLSKQLDEIKQLIK